MATLLTILIAVLFAPAAPPRCQVEGRVVDSAGVPLAGVSVRLSSVGEAWTTELSDADLAAEVPGGHVVVITAADGRFAFDLPVPTASWVMLYITGSDYHGITGRAFGVAGGRNKEPLRAGKNELGDFVLVATGAIAGRVTDAGGAPLADATVSLSGSFPGGYAVNCSSESDGNYRLGHVPEGTYAVGCKREGYRSEGRAGITVRNAGTSPAVDFVLQAALTISGRVVDPLGQPVANVRIWGWPTASGSGAGARSDVEGRFTISLPQNDPYVLEADLQGYESYEEGHGSVGHPPGTSDVRIVLRPLPKMRFLVVDAQSGVGVEDYGLIFEAMPRPGDFAAQNENHADLRSYHFEGGAAEWWAAPGQHEYLIQAAGYAPQRGPVRFDPGTVNQQTIPLVRGGTLRGILLFEDRPRSGTVIHLDRWPRDAMDSFTGRRRSTVADALGQFEFTDLATGSYRIAVAAEGVAPHTHQRFDLFAPQIVDLGAVRLERPAAIAGHVLVAEGRPRGGIMVCLGDPYDDVFQVTDNAGRFRFENLASGSHRLHVGDKVAIYANETKAHQVITRAGEESAVVIDLRETPPVPPAPPSPTGRLDVRVTLDGRLGSGLPITAASIGDSWIQPGSVRTDGKGAARFEALPEGPHVLHVWTATGLPLGRGEQTVSNRGAAEPLQITLESGELVVELPDGTTVPHGATVWLSVWQQDVSTHGPPLNGSVDVSNWAQRSSGQPADIPRTAQRYELRYELGVIGVGRWVVEVGGDVLPYRKTVVIEPGQTTVCRMTLDDVP